MWNVFIFTTPCLKCCVEGRKRFPYDEHLQSSNNGPFFASVKPVQTRFIHHKKIPLLNDVSIAIKYSSFQPGGPKKIHVQTM